MKRIKFIMTVVVVLGIAYGMYQDEQFNKTHSQDHAPESQKDESANHNG